MWQPCKGPSGIRLQTCQHVDTTVTTSGRGTGLEGIEWVGRAGLGEVAMNLGRVEWSGGKWRVDSVALAGCVFGEKNRRRREFRGVGGREGCGGCGCVRKNWEGLTGSERSIFRYLRLRIPRPAAAASRIYKKAQLPFGLIFGCNINKVIHNT